MAQSASYLERPRARARVGDIVQVLGATLLSVMAAVLRRALGRRRRTNWSFGFEVRVWDAMWHNWPMYAGLPEADGAMDEVREFLAGLVP